MPSPCGTCEVSLKSVAAEKDPDERSEQEQAILDGEEEVPFAFGPLSSFDGDPCPFCHRMGHVGAIVVALVLAGYARLWGLGPAWQATIAGCTWFVFFLVVLWLGRFPVLGALAGPIVERFFARFGVYLTPHARQEYAPKGARADGGMPRAYKPRPTEDIVAADIAEARLPRLDEPGVLWSVATDDQGNIEAASQFVQDSPVNKYRRRRDRVGLDREHLADGRDEPTTIHRFAEYDDDEEADA